MKAITTLFLFLGFAASALAQTFISSEDRSRFQEQPYRKAEPGLLAPSAYVEIAKRAVHSRYKDIHFNMFSEGIVSHRFYKSAPAADRDIICVAFTYLAPQSGGGTIGQGFTNLRADPALPGVLVLIRRDRSKIYVNPVHYTPV